MKRLLRICLSFLLMLGLFMLPLDLFPAKAETGEFEKESHFVILFDVSGSMLDVDPEYQARNMVSKFVSIILEKACPIKLAVIPFSTKCSDGINKNWSEMANGPMDEFNKEIESINYINGAYTNIGLALERCNKTLEEMRADGTPCTQSVLFITDGVIRMPGDGSTETEIKNIIGSYEKTIEAANEFPLDAYFLGVIPEISTTEGAPEKDAKEDAEESTGKYVKERIEYDETGTKVLSYATIEVPTEYQDKMAEVAHWNDTFCEIINTRQAERSERNYPARCKALDWSDEKNCIKELEAFFSDFVHTIWGANTTEKDDADLNSGYSIQIPESTIEADICITPKAESADERRSLVQNLLSNLSVSKDQNLYENWRLLDAIDTATVKLIDPDPGIYTLQQLSEKSFLVDMRFIVYGDINIFLADDHLEGVLGEPLTITGSVVGQNQKGVSEALMQYIQPDFVLLSAEGDPLNEQPEISFEKNEFFYTYTPTSIGQFQANLGIGYDDTNKKDSPAGISHYENKDAFVTITVPEVEYTPAAVRDTKDPSKATVSLTPFSTISGQRILVNASNCQAYLQDQWILNYNGEETALVVSDDGKEFLVEIEALQTESTVVTLHNKTSEQDISLEIPSLQTDPLQKTDKFCETVLLFWMPGSGCSQTLSLDEWFTDSNGNLYTLNPESAEFALVSTDSPNYRLQYQEEHGLHLWPEEKALTLTVSNSHGLATEEYVITVLDCGLLWCVIIAAVFLLILIIVFTAVKNHNTTKLEINMPDGSTVKKRVKRNGSYTKVNGIPESTGSNLRIYFDTHSNFWHYVYNAPDGRVNDQEVSDGGNPNSGRMEIFILAADNDTDEN